MIEAQKAKETEAIKNAGKPHVLLSAEEIKTLNHARNVVAAAVHPDTGNVIPIPMRVTFYLPGNMPSSTGFVFAAPTLFNTIIL